MEERFGQPAGLADKVTVQQLDVILRQLDALPTLPAVATRLLEWTTRAGCADARDRRAALAEVIPLIAADPSLTARMLSLANASSPGRARTAAQAVEMLGLDAVRSAVLSMDVFETLPPGGATQDEFDRRGFWRHCLAVASAAQMLAERAQLPVDRGEVFVCGLLHDIGKVALAHLLPKSYARALTRARGSGGSIAEHERKFIGVDHLVVGRRLAQRWSLPRTVQHVIWLHHQPSDAIPPSVAEAALIRIVALADAVARKQRIGFSGNPYFPQPPEELAGKLGLSEAAVADVAGGLAEMVETRASALCLDRADSGAIHREALGRANAELGRLNEQFRRRGQQLAAQAAAFGHFCDFAAALGSDAAVGDVLKQAADVFLAARDFGPAGPGPVVAYSIDEDGAAVLAVRCDGARRPAWRTFPLAGQVETGSATDLPAPAPEALAPLLADVRPWDEWADSSGCTHQPLVFAGRWLGGVVYPSSGADAAERQEADQVCRALGAALAMALAIVQQRCRAVALSEELAGASQEFAAVQEALAEAKALAAGEDLAAGAAHELNTPLAVVSGRAQLMGQKARTKRQREAWQLIAEQAQRISDILTELMDIASPPQPRPDELPPAELLREAAEAFSSSDHPQAETSRVDIEVGDDTPAIWADRAQVRSVLVELMTNAATAATSAPHIRLMAEADDANSAVLLTVRDDGPGMDEQTLARACTPFFSAQQAGRRRGLGLPRARRYVENNGGKIWLISQPGEGTTVRIQLPSVRRRRRGSRTAGSKP